MKPTDSPASWHGSKDSQRWDDSLSGLAVHSEEEHCKWTKRKIISGSNLEEYLIDLRREKDMHHLLKIKETIKKCELLHDNLNVWQNIVKSSTNETQRGAEWLRQWIVFNWGLLTCHHLYLQMVSGSGNQIGHGRDHCGGCGHYRNSHGLVPAATPWPAPPSL